MFGCSNASVIWSAKRSGQPWMGPTRARSVICSLGVLPQRLGGGPAFQQAAATWAGPGQSSPAISNAAGNVATRGPPATPVHNNPRSSRLAHSSSRAMARSGHRARNTASLVGGARFDRHPTAGRRRATAAHKGGQTVSQVSRSRRSSVRVSSALSRGWSRSVSNFSMRLAVQWWRSTSRSQPRSAASVARACSTRRRARSRGA